MIHMKRLLKIETKFECQMVKYFCKNIQAPILSTSLQTDIHGEKHKINYCCLLKFKSLSSNFGINPVLPQVVFSFLFYQNPKLPNKLPSIF